MFDALNAEFGIPRALSILPGSNELPKVVLTHQSGRACRGISARRARDFLDGSVRG